MDSRSSVFYLGIPCGTWFQTQVRVSFWFPFLVAVFVLQMGLNVGLAVSAILFVSVLIHEFAHIAAARATGGDGDEILIWPLGGLAFTQPGPTLSSEFLTAAAGPISNLVLLTGSLALLSFSGFAVRSDIFWLFTLPEAPVTNAILRDVLLLAASINFKLLCINLLPAVPLDGGTMALGIARSRWPGPIARIWTLRLGQLVSVALAFVGLVLNQTFPIFLAFFLAVYNLHDYFLAMFADQMDDPSLSQEFGNGYGAYVHAEREIVRKPGPIARWRQKRHEEKRQREEAERMETERTLDSLLEKVHREGMTSLSDAERRFLNRASTRYRSHEH
jgi:Zn-dependent protease